MKIKVLTLVLVLTLLLTGCGAEDKKEPIVTITADQTQEEAPEQRTDYRVLITSDMHCTFVNKWYGLSNEERMQHWVDSVLAEHERHPIDLIIFAGDLSLDFWGGSGTYERFEKSTTAEFIEKYVSQLPNEIVKLYLPGNHEAYTNEKWVEITGFERQFSYLLGNNLFICVDSFGPGNQTDYTPMNVSFIKGEMEKYPDTNVYLVGHAFYENKESDAFKAIVRDKRVVGLFQGHTHISDLITLSDKSGNKTLAQSGHFSFSEAEDPMNDFWGFRDIVITEDSMVSSYIQVNSRAGVKHAEKMTDVPAAVQNTFKYKFR